MNTAQRDPSEALSTTDTARALGVAPRTVKRMSPDVLPYFRVNTRGDRRYRAADVARFVAERSQGDR